MLRQALIEHARDADPIDWPLRTLLYARDQLRLCFAEPEAVSAWLIEPSSTGSKEWDTLLAAVIAHEFDASDLTPPAWATGRRLDRPWLPEHPFWSADEIRATTPEWLGRAGIFMPARDLETA